LPRDAPVLDVVQPLVVGVDPVLREEADLARSDTGESLAGDAAAVGAGLAHRHEPLVGEHRLDDDTGTIAARHLQEMRLDLVEEALLLRDR
jgi:hypothetical protein